MTIESKLREKFQVPQLNLAPELQFRHLAAFWQHFTLHKRTCDKTGESLISVFHQNCPYPVWKASIWFDQAHPPSIEYNPNKKIFEQMWEVFQKSPIPHNVGLSSNENCDYTDDWWDSKNCYLCHSGFQCQDLRCSYRTLGCSDSQRIAFTFHCQFCSELTNCYDCYQVHHSLNSRNCRDSLFLFDCRNCSDCILCWNLRNKQYYIRNEPTTKEEYFAFKEKLELYSRKTFERFKEEFQRNILERAWWRGEEIDHSENAHGSYLDHTKNVYNCHFIQEAEDCCHCLRGYDIKDSLYSVGSGIGVEHLYNCSHVNEKCYDVRNSTNVNSSSFMEYCAFCSSCQNCFGCCGLLRKEYCIFNKQYSPAKYKEIVAKIKLQLKAEGGEGSFFPAYFAACPYDETFAGYAFPLSDVEQQKLGFRLSSQSESSSEGCHPLSAVPDAAQSIEAGLYEKIFWDDIAKRRFQIGAPEVKFALQHSLPLPNAFYTQDLKNLYRWMFFDGSLKQVACAKTGKKFLTHLPTWLHPRALSNEAYGSCLI